jgi:hypothetical protein
MVLVRYGIMFLDPPQKNTGSGRPSILINLFTIVDGWWQLYLCPERNGQ